MKNNINSLLGRGVVDVIVKEELAQKLKSGKKLRVKLGIDPTGSELHLGHAVVLKKLREFQDRGDTAILLIGDYTAKIGDPTGKSETRVMLNEEQIHQNMKSYIQQASKILDIDKLEIRYNSEWFEKMSMAQILELTSKKTVNQMLQREDFKNRYKHDQDISLVELLYPMLQGFDSVMLESDIELGGTDQLFNMLVGRDLQKKYDTQTIQNIITVPILEGLDGVEKMSKSLNNYIGIMESASQIYGKTMSIPDNMIVKYFELASNISLQNIEKIKVALAQGENPRNLKMALARELVAMYHNLEAAQEAEREFIEIFANKGLPELPDNQSIKKEIGIIELLVNTKLASTNSEARRKIQEGAVKIRELQCLKIPNVDKIQLPKGTKIEIQKNEQISIGEKGNLILPKNTRITPPKGTPISFSKSTPVQYTFGNPMKIENINTKITFKKNNCIFLLQVGKKQFKIIYFQG